MGAKGLITLVVSLLVLGIVSSDAPRLVDAAEVQELVASQRGKVVLLNFWATWCPPCVREFPDIVEVAKDFGGRGVTVISVSLDFPGKVEKELLPFLEKHPPAFEVYLKQDGDPVTFTRTIDPEWKGTLPATFFYDRRGKPSMKRYSAMSRSEIERVLNTLLEEPFP